MWDPAAPWETNLRKGILLCFTSLRPGQQGGAFTSLHVSLYALRACVLDNGGAHLQACMFLCPGAKIMMGSYLMSNLRSMRANSMQFEVKSDVNAGQFDAI